MSGKRYAVVSCHVERLGDDNVWACYRGLFPSRAGFRIASLVRPPDTEAGEDEERWLQRARELEGLGPFGHHTHWTSPTHARPTGNGTGDRVLREGSWLRSQGLAPTLFVGGGWYTDGAVAAACSDLGYVDCTPRARRPRYLAAGELWAELAAPALIELTEGTELLAVPTTHSMGDALREGLRPRGLPDGLVHAYFHDTDLLDRRRRSAIVAALRLLAARCEVTDLAGVAAGVTTERVAWSDVARGGSAGPPE